MAAISITWDASVPAGSDALSAGDDAIRNFKAGIVERLRNGGHQWQTAGATADESDGRHLCGEAFAAGSAVSLAGEFYIYAADGTTAIATFRDSTAATPSELFLSTNALRCGAGTFTGLIKPEADNTRDLGVAATNRWRDLHVGRNALIGGTLGVTGATTFTGVVTFNAAVTHSAVESFPAGISVATQIDIQGAQTGTTITSVASGTTAVGAAWRIVLANLTANATITLPAAASSSGRELWITVATADIVSRVLTVDGNGAELIDDQAAITVVPRGFGTVDRYRAVHIICDGTQWFLLEARLTT